MNNHESSYTLVKTEMYQFEKNYIAITLNVKAVNRTQGKCSSSPSIIDKKFLNSSFIK